MGSIIIACESQFGSTRRVAEAIVEGINEVSGRDMVLNELKGANRCRGAPRV